MIKVLLVCLGNICRSPTAHGVLELRVRERGLQDCIEIDSAGTAAWHVGKQPDQRSMAAALKRGVDLSHLKARAVTDQDFEYYDYILAMDAENLHNLQAMSPSHFKGELAFFLSFDQNSDNVEVPDPYYGGDKGFEDVLDMVSSASDAFLEHVLKQHRL